MWCFHGGAEALQGLIKTIEDLDQAQELREQSDLSDEAFSIQVYLQGNDIEEAEQIARETSEVLEDNPHWRESTEQERRVRISLYKSLKGMERDAMLIAVEEIMRMLKRGS